MKKLLYLILPFCLLLYSCNCNTMENNKVTIQKCKQEIIETEQNFAKMAKEEGIYKAFTTYAANDAVLMRNDSLIIGKKAIELFYKNKNSKELSWKPDFVDVAASGDLGYTYGHYTYSYLDSNNKLVENTGTFHTVWKKQSNKTWRFVWD